MTRICTQVPPDASRHDTKGSVTLRYESLVRLGEINPNPAQQHLCLLLDKLASRLMRERLNERHGQKRGGADQITRKSGFYIHGPVGGGKTMLLDMFFESIDLPAKRRMHIHEFIADFHNHLETTRPPNAERRARCVAVRSPFDGIELLCIDELAVSEIGDATILSRVFADLLSQGTILVMTANIAPDGLYECGINRVLFTPLIRLLSDELEVVRLDTGADYRLEKPEGDPVWHVPADAAADAVLDAMFVKLTGGAASEKLSLSVCGHEVEVPKQARGVARFSFKDLCLAPLWTSDYRAIAQTFRTVMIEEIPLRFTHRNHARRFCALIDILHGFRVKLVASAGSEPDGLYAGMMASLQPAFGPSSSLSETSPEALEFRRTVSRLHEMRSAPYAASKWCGDN
jgi:cell division protein ZapE